MSVEVRIVERTRALIQKLRKGPGSQEDPVGAYVRPRRPEGSAGAAVKPPKEEVIFTRVKDRKIS